MGIISQPRGGRRDLGRPNEFRGLGAARRNPDTQRITPQGSPSDAAYQADPHGHHPRA